MAFLQACTSQAWQFASLDQIQTVVSPSDSSLPAYDLTAAQWVEGQPLLVNKDFNFGMAMSMEGVGVAIAAGMRINKNKELVAVLNSLPPLDLEQYWRAKAKRLGGKWRDKPLLIYAQLFGQPQAHLRTVVEFYSNSQLPRRYMDISVWGPVTGKNSWTEGNGRKLLAQVYNSLVALIDIIEQDLSSSGEEINYHLSGGEAVQRGVGRVMVRSGDYILIESVSTPNTVIRFPTQNLNLIVKADDDPNAL